MKRIGCSFLLATLVAAAACDSGEASEPKVAAAVADKPEPAKAAPPAPPSTPAEPAAPAVEVSDAMKAFMSELGEHDKVKTALKKHGAGGLGSKMGLYNIEEPVVTASNPGAAQGETCYAMEAKTGVVRRKFDVCWKGETITRADDKGLKL